VKAEFQKQTHVPSKCTKPDGVMEMSEIALATASISRDREFAGWQSTFFRCLRGISETAHIPPFFFFSSARAFLADMTSGASVFRGSAVWMNGCCRAVRCDLLIVGRVKTYD
jgi:hypothetical protein